MLPIIDYQLNNLFSYVDNILDDDNSKIGKYFPNIGTQIKSLKNKFEEFSCFNSICFFFNNKKIDINS